MHGNLLKLDNEIQAQPHPAALQIPEFKSLVDECDNPRVMLGYIYHIHNPESPYSNYEEGMRKEEVKNDLLGDEEADIPDVVKEAEQKYVELTRTPEQKLLDKAVNSIYSLMDYLDAFDPTETDENGKLVWSTKDYIRNMEKLNSVVDSVRDLRDKVEEGEGTGGDIRGGVELSKWNK